MCTLEFVVVSKYAFKLLLYKSPLSNGAPDPGLVLIVRLFFVLNSRSLTGQQQQDLPYNCECPRLTDGTSTTAQ